MRGVTPFEKCALNRDAKACQGREPSSVVVMFGCPASCRSFTSRPGSSPPPSRSGTPHSRLWPMCASRTSSDCLGHPVLNVTWIWIHLSIETKRISNFRNYVSFINENIFSWGGIEMYLVAPESWQQHQLLQHDVARHQPVSKHCCIKAM